jgi:hypothetical protein
LLDCKGEGVELVDLEVEELCALSDELHSLSWVHSSICWQQHRLNGLREGDANSKYFHVLMSRQRIGSNISSFLVNGVRVEGVSKVHHAEISPFKGQYKAASVERPGVENLNFRILSYNEIVTLLKPFILEEVKAAVWDYDSNKAPGLDGVSVGFIKEFWVELKDDIMWFVTEFIRLGN